MRKLPKPKALPDRSRKKLEEKTKEILAIADFDQRKARAEKIYEASRKQTNDGQWFKEIVDELRAVSGPGCRCMLCSGSESSQVEHFQPKAFFPEKAMDWENFLWSCGICNLAKGDRYPTDADKRYINPRKENPWDFFFLDEFGQLTWKVDAKTRQPMGRAKSTMENMGLDREDLQVTRNLRYKALCSSVYELLDLHAHGHRTVEQLQERLQALREEPSQPDVADYFLCGPGSQVDPFKAILKICSTPKIERWEGKSTSNQSRAKPRGKRS